MQRKIITTADGSKTIYLPAWNEHYHSKHGAMQEALHVYIKMGFTPVINRHKSRRINILEMGFGTGLNAFLTAMAAHQVAVQTEYTGIEAFPLEAQELNVLNYARTAEEKDLFQQLHQTPWEKRYQISPYFTLKKCKKRFQEVDEINAYDLVYFDAFGARVQPELWTEKMFSMLYKALRKNGVLVTYAAKGTARRAMETAGFTVEKLPGPPGKREMLRATKKPA
ncbi:MAG TPA: tRNA (5-methylaminomethyl-2-thiouridine)(34)-methyltransferase MnmD [Flavobacteriaceae bacterium]|nr:tRNA (5-methylaminomethyl-2-thiouridine)(34)-methyltransferase MnmD [Flavobacteriaceae bacterium]